MSDAFRFRLQPLLDEAIARREEAAGALRVAERRLDDARRALDESRTRLDGARAREHEAVDHLKKRTTSGSGAVLRAAGEASDAFRQRRRACEEDVAWHVQSVKASDAVVASHRRDLDAISAEVETLEKQKEKARLAWLKEQERREEARRDEDASIAWNAARRRESS